MSAFSMALGRSKSVRLQLHPPRPNLGEIEDVVHEDHQVIGVARVLGAKS
jgi:hypothetical protein